MTCGWHAATVVNISVTAWKHPTPGRCAILPRCALRSGGWKSSRNVWVKPLRRRGCKDCGANPYWDILTLADAPIQPRLCELRVRAKPRERVCNCLKLGPYLTKLRSPRVKSSWCRSMAVISRCRPAACDEKRGDHICYISDLSKTREYFPKWDITKGLRTTFEEIPESWIDRTEHIALSAQLAKL